MKKRSKKIKRFLGIVLTLLLLPGMIPYVSADTAAEFTEETESAPTELSSADRGSISGILWHDENSDGIRDDGETGIAHYPVSLYKAGNTDNAVRTAIADADGSYTFTDIEQDTYVVGIKPEMVSGSEYLLPLADFAGDNEFTLGTMDGNLACTETIVVQANSEITGIDAGLWTVKRIQSEDPETYNLNVGNLTGTAIGNGVSISDNQAIFSSVNPLDTYVVEGTSATNTIIINSGETVNLILSSVNIKTLMSPIQLLRNAVVDMTLSGANMLKCTGGNGAGLYVGQGATLTIGGTIMDTLSATGGLNSSGIGTSFNNEINCCGTVNITGGKITATGMGNAAGIGGSVYGSVGTVNITGGMVDATGGGAGIGGGYYGDCGTVNITGGMVIATGGKSFDGTGGAGIGGGYFGSGGVITISGGTVTATGGKDSMDIGYGGDGKDKGGTTIITGGSVWPTRGSSNVNNPTNGPANGGDKVDMTTLPSLASQDFSFVAAGSIAVYTYAGTGHEGAGHLWIPLPGVTTDAVTDLNTTPAEVTAPDTANSPASSKATLNGTFYLNNTKPVTNAYFEWGTTTSYGTTIPVAGSSEETATDAILRSADLTGLDPGTDYNYRFVIETNGVIVYGDNITFTTPVLVPSVDAAHNLTGNTTATLYGIYDLNGDKFQNGEFQISTTGLDGPWITLTNTSTPAISSATGVTADTGQLDQSTTAPSVNLKNLTLNTDYYYRFIITNHVGTSEAKGSWHQEGFPDLKIDKTVTGSYGDPNKGFEITITLMNGSTPVTGSFEYTGSAISGVNAPDDGSILLNESGQGTINLKHGQAITIDGMPQGSTYTVRETDPAVTGGIYTATYSGTGIISDSKDSISETLGGTTATVFITNDRSTVPVSGLKGRIDYRLGAAGFIAVMTMLFSCHRRRKCK